MFRPSAGKETGRYLEAARANKRRPRVAIENLGAKDDKLNTTNLPKAKAMAAILQTPTPDFQTLPVGTRVVFCERGNAMEELYTFGIVAAGRSPRDKKRVQMVYTDQAEVNDSPLQRRLTPHWDRPLPGQILSVTMPRDHYLEGQHIRGNVDEVFEPYEEGKTYVDHYSDTD